VLGRGVLVGPAARAARGGAYGVPAHEILQRAGQAGYVGGQEDMLIDIALRLAQARRSPPVTRLIGS